tara:strand:- start:657 stop:1007 length:351 start_codon:yes stop_codon:yes gene_type:complete
MKRTEEILLNMVKAEVEIMTKTLRDEMANRILEEVCKKALVEAGAHTVQLYDLHKGMLKPEFNHSARHSLAEAADRKTRVQIKIGPKATLREPLLLDIKEMIDKELDVQYQSRGKK